MGFEKSGLEGPVGSNKLRGCRTNLPAELQKVRQIRRKSTYPHNEQIKHSMPSEASLDPELVESSLAARPESQCCNATTGFADIVVGISMLMH